MSSTWKSPSPAPPPPPGGVKPPSLGQSVASTPSAPSTPANDSVSNEAVAAAVLIVDEDPSFRLGLQTFLKEFVGFQNIYSAANGLEALECLRENDDIEIVTLDQDMPEMDGLTFLKIVKDGDFPSLAAVMITGDPDASIEAKFRSLNSDDLVTEHFLEKPVDFNDLEAVLLSSHKTLKNREKDSAAKATAAAVAAFAGGSSVVATLKKEDKATGAEKDITKNQQENGDDKAMNNQVEKTNADTGAPAAEEKEPTKKVPVLAALPSTADKEHNDGFGGADWMGAGPPQTGGASAGVGGSSGAGNDELRARVDWLAESLNGRLDKIDSQVANVSARMPSMAERFWLGLLKWATLGLLVWAFVRFEAGDQIVKYYGVAKAKVEEMTSAGKSSSMTLEPEENEVGPGSKEQDSTKVGSDGGRENTDDTPRSAPPAPKADVLPPTKAAPSVEKTQPEPEPKSQAKPDANASPRPAPAPAKSKPAQADRPKAPPAPKSAPKAAAKPDASKDAGDEKSKPKAAVGGKGDPEKAKAREGRQRNSPKANESAKPKVKPKKKAEPTPASAPKPDTAGDAVSE